MFKRIINNQALINGLKQIKRSDNNEQQQVVVAGNQANLLSPIYETSNKGGAIELQEFCNTIVSADSAIFKIAKQICAEQGSRIKEIAVEVLKDSGLANTKKLDHSTSTISNPSITIVKPSSPFIPSPSNGLIIPEQKQTETKFYGTNKMFQMEDEIVNISGTKNTSIISITHSSDETNHSLNMDIVKQLLLDIFGKLKNLVMVLLNSLFGNRQNTQSDHITNQVAAQSLVLVISFMIYNIVVVNSPNELSHDILIVFQDYLSNHLNN